MVTGDILEGILSGSFLFSCVPSLGLGTNYMELNEQFKGMFITISQ